MYIAFYIPVDGFLGQLVESRAATCFLSCSHTMRMTLVMISNSEWGYEWRWWGTLACLAERLKNSEHCWTSKEKFHLGLSAGCWRAISWGNQQRESRTLLFIFCKFLLAVLYFSPQVLIRVLDNGEENIPSCTFGEPGNASTTEVLFNLLVNRLLNQLAWMIFLHGGSLYAFTCFSPKCHAN